MNCLFYRVDPGLTTHPIDHTEWPLKSSGLFKRRSEAQGLLRLEIKYRHFAMKNPQTKLFLLLDNHYLEETADSVASRISLHNRHKVSRYSEACLTKLIRISFALTNCYRLELQLFAFAAVVKFNLVVNFKLIISTVLGICSVPLLSDVRLFRHAIWPSILYFRNAQRLTHLNRTTVKLNLNWILFTSLNIPCGSHFPALNHSLIIAYRGTGNKYNCSQTINGYL